MTRIDERMNVVWVCTDDQPYDTFDHMPYVTSAEFGAVLCPQATNVAPMCSPSRMTHFTGRRARRAGGASNDATAAAVRSMVDPRQMLPRVMQKAGYRTYLVGKYLSPGPSLMDKPGDNVPQGWDGYANTGPNRYYNNQFVLGGPTRDESAVGDQTASSGASVYRTDLEFEQATSFIDSAGTRPFWMCLTPEAPHRSAETPAIVPAARHADLPIDLVLSPSFNEADVRDKPTWLRKRWPNAAGANRQEFWRSEHIAALRAMRAIDEGIKGLVQHLDEIGKLDNTVFFFWGDNGFLWGEHRHDFGKGVPYREAIRLGLAVRWPGVAGRVDNALFTNADVAVTTAAIAGTRFPVAADGQYMGARIADPAVAWRTATLIERETENPTSMYGVGGYTCLTTGILDGYTYVEYEDGTGDIELYDHVTDPAELNNLAGKGNPAQAELVAQLAQVRLG